MVGSGNEFGIPQKTLNVSRARYQFTRLLRRLQASPRIYLITQSGKPAGALVNLNWLETLLARAQGNRSFSLFGQATASEDWEQSLRQLRQSLTARTLGRYARTDQ